MDIQAYISSGIIEAYVLGLASNDEVRELEMYAAQYAQVKQSITDFEMALEEQALQTAIQPPAFLKEKIMTAIAATAVENKGDKEVVSGLEQNATTQAKVVSITAAPKSVRWLRGAVAASVILFLGSAILNFYYYSQYKEYKDQYTKINNDYNTLLTQHNTEVAKNNAIQASLKEINGVAVVKVPMEAASPKDSGLLATVYWDKQSKDVFLVVSNLPQPPVGKQYQLWAVDVVNNALSPADAGMVPIDAQTETIFTMKKAYKAQKFAITLEDAGGKPSPDLQQLKVISNVSI